MDPKYLALNQGNLLELRSGPHRQHFTLSECKLGLCVALRALAINSETGFRLDLKVAWSLGRDLLLESGEEYVRSSFE